MKYTIREDFFAFLFKKKKKKTMLMFGCWFYHQICSTTTSRSIV